MEKYEVFQIDENTWRIEEYNSLCNVYMYLLTGEREALLIDAGYGNIPLDQIVASLTTLPVQVILTHGHYDHIGGTGLFERVLIHPEDVKMYGIYAESAEKTDMTDSEKKVPKLNRTVTLLREGEEIDLGGRKLQVIHVPGHSGGCICLLDAQREWLFTGDTCCEGDILLHLRFSQKPEVYLQSLRKLKKEKYKVIWPAHHRVPLEPEIVKDLEEAAELVCSGTVEGETVETSFGTAKRFGYKKVGIIYREDGTPETAKEE